VNQPQEFPQAPPDKPIRVFFGRVLPERTAVSLDGVPDLLIRADGHDVFLLRLHLDASSIVIECRGGATIADADLKETVRNITSTFVDCLGFVRGCGYQVEITSVGGDSAAVFGVAVGAGERDPVSISAKTAALIQLLLERDDGSMTPYIGRSRIIVERS